MSTIRRRPIRLIASDIDGTMLRPDGTLSPRVRESLHRASDRGIHVVPATGRPSIVSNDVIEALGLDGYWIFGNGAVTHHAGRDETVRCYWMDTAIAERIVVDLRAALPGVGFAFELDRSVAHEAGFTKRVPVTAPPSPAVTDILTDLPERLHKVIAFHDDYSIDELFSRVTRAVGDSAVVSYSGLPFIEIAASVVTKATALHELCVDLGVDREEVAAFGDNHNDLPMLGWAGRGFAMGNATDDARAAADHVIGRNDEDGLADAVDALVAEHD